MKYDKYVISFAPGSSGRFVRTILDRMILDLNDKIDICDKNSAHNNDKFTGLQLTKEEYRYPNVYEFATFLPPESHSFRFSCILASHIYPNFNVINQRFNNVGIILVKPDDDDIPEILFNAFYKNDDKKVNSVEIEVFAPKFISKNKPFFQDDIYPENCLLLNYKDIYEIDDGKYRLIEILKEFTGITTVPDVVYSACKQYIDNRTRMIKDYGLR